MGDRWWAIHEDELLRSLREAAAGADPDVVLLELTANTEPPPSPTSSENT